MSEKDKLIQLANEMIGDSATVESKTNHATRISYFEHTQKNPFSGTISIKPHRPV